MERNLILAVLPERERQLVRDVSQVITVHEGKMLVMAGGSQESLYFPSTATLSLLAVTSDGLSVQTALIGPEGMAGLPQLFGHPVQSLECVTQHSGEVVQIPVTAVRNPALRTLQSILLSYAGYRLAELAQAAVCNKFHRVRQRLCRWLLTAQDRTKKREMDFTQETLAAIVGARRPVVASLIGSMEREGLVSYRRGCIEILDRNGLTSAACDCYGLLADALHQHLAERPRPRR